MLVKFVFILTPGRPLLETDALAHAVVIVRVLKKCGGGGESGCGILVIILLEIRSVERGICPIAVLYFAVKRSFFNI